MATIRVHVGFDPDPPDRAVLEELLDPRVEVSFGEVPSPGDFEVLVKGVPGREELTASPALRMLVIPYAGLPVKTRKLLADFPHLAVHNLHHNAVTCGEMAVALLLAAAKMVVPMDRELREGRWSGRGLDNPAVLLSGKTLLILGYGAIGRRVAAACRALGMEVVGVARTAAQGETRDGVEVFPPEDLRRLLPRADALLVSVPLTGETEGMVGKEEIGLLPPGAVLVNVARGPVVDEGALYEALAGGHLHSAGIDVWYRYPGRDGNPEDTPPSDLPFGELKNVVMSPHRGGWLHEVEAYRMRDLAALLNAAARGEPVPHRVDPDAGY